VSRTELLERVKSLEASLSNATIEALKEQQKLISTMTGEFAKVSHLGSTVVGGGIPSVPMASTSSIDRTPPTVMTMRNPQKV
jgi:GrpB-like predicted nucleotidyltransferase (UPF0157 family)